MTEKEYKELVMIRIVGKVGQRTGSLAKLIKEHLTEQGIECFTTEEPTAVYVDAKSLINFF